ncbi:MAG: YraN family protein [Thiotrichaceae bacterium]
MFLEKQIKKKLAGLTSKQIGDKAEQIACDYLQKKGLTLITSNFTSRFGEIDLIMQDSKQTNTVFVEVRYRKNKQFGGAAISVTPQKQQRIIKTALYYMQQHEPDASARFDVVAIEGDISGGYEIDWIRDAFQ